MRPITRREAIKRGGRFLFGAAAFSLSSGFLAGCSDSKVDMEMASRIMKNMQPAAIDGIRLTVIYDNVPYRRELKKDWGFSCLIEGLDKTILFDAGRYDDIFLENLVKLRIDPRQIDELFISHDHPDHTGGSLKLLEIQNRINVSVVKSFPSGFKKLVTTTGAILTETDQPHRVSSNCLSTGQMPSAVKKEHSLVMLTEKGSIIVTGCAHPGVVEIVERAKAITDRDVLLLVGGFHLVMDDAAGMRQKALRLQELGVRYVAPSHCTGGEAKKIFAEVYGDRFVSSGVGRVITGNNLL